MRPTGRLPGTHANPGLGLSVVEAQAPERDDGADPADRPTMPGAGWRSVLAVVVVAMTVLGATTLTDDSWPFAPFRMFARAVKPNGQVVKVDFVGATRSGRSVRLDASEFGLRRAEVEGQQGRGGRLTENQMASLFRNYNARHRADPLVRLEFRKVGRKLVGGRPTSSFARPIQAWPHGDPGS